MKPVPIDELLAGVVLRIINHGGDGKGLALHMAADRDVVGWTGQTPSEEWYLVRHQNTEWFKIINAGVGLELHMAANNDVVGWNDGGDSNLWRFMNPDSPLYELGWYVIENKKSGLQLHMATHNKDVVGYDTNNKGPNQWRLFVAGSVELVKIEYHTAELKKDIKPSNLITITYNNNTDTTLRPVWKEEYSRSTVDRHTFDWKFGYTFSQKLSASVMVVGIGFSGEVSHSITTEIGESRTTEKSEEEKHIFELPTEVPPRRKVQVTVTLQEATVDVPYTAHFKSGGATWTQRGTYDGVRYGNRVVDIQDMGPADPGAPPETIL